MSGVGRRASPTGRKDVACRARTWRIPRARMHPAPHPAREPGSALGVSSIVRVILPALLLATVLLVVVIDFAGPLSNPDTYFHLRFGREFLDGWSLRDPGSVTHAGDRALGADPVAPGDRHGQVRRLVRAPGRRLAGRAPGHGARRRPVGRGPASRGAPAGRGPRHGVAARRLDRASPLAPRSSATSSWSSPSTPGCAPPTTVALRWWLVPMTWVWAMCHGMWPVGIAIGGVVLIGMALDRRTTMRRWWLLACVPALSAVAAALTPVGPELYVQELRVQDRSAFFSEWHSPHLTNHACLDGRLPAGPHPDRAGVHAVARLGDGAAVRGRGRLCGVDLAHRAGGGGDARPDRCALPCGS